jgi:hypothetical protein
MDPNRDLIMSIVTTMLTKGKNHRKMAKCEQTAAQRMWTPLMVAILRGKQAIKVHAIIEEMRRTSSLPLGAPVPGIDAKDNKGRTALYWAVRGRTTVPEIVADLLNAGANPLLGTPTSSPLMLALQGNDLDRADVMWPYASNRRNPAHLERLWTEHPNQPATLNETTEQARKRWYAANNTVYNMFATNFLVTRWLLQKLGDELALQHCVDVPTVVDPFDTALSCKNSSVAVATLYLKLYARNGRNLGFGTYRAYEAEDRDYMAGTTLVNRLATTGKTESLAWLLEVYAQRRPFEINAPSVVDARLNGTALTPLHQSIVSGHNNSVLLLLAHGANPTLTAVIDGTPLSAYECAVRKDTVGGHVVRALHTAVQARTANV